MSGNTRVMGRVLGIAVAQVVLHRPQIGALIGKVIAAGMPEHMGQTFPRLAFSPATRTMLSTAWRVSWACRSDTNNQGRLSSRVAR